LKVFGQAFFKRLAAGGTHPSLPQFYSLYPTATKISFVLSTSKFSKKVSINIKKTKKQPLFHQNI
jgi:hypothetical protein